MKKYIYSILCILLGMQISAATAQTSRNEFFDKITKKDLELTSTDLEKLYKEFRHKFYLDDADENDYYLSKFQNKIGASYAREGHMAKINEYVNKYIKAGHYIITISHLTDELIKKNDYKNTYLIVKKVLSQEKVERQPDYPFIYQLC